MEKSKPQLNRQKESCEKRKNQTVIHSLRKRPFSFCTSYDLSLCLFFTTPFSHSLLPCCGARQKESCEKRKNQTVIHSLRY
jgi:hypothetical protein